MVNNHDQIIVAAMVMGALFAWPLGYWKGKEIGNQQGRLEYRKLERAKREGK